MTEVRITAGAARQLDRLPLSIQMRMLQVFKRLAAWPVISGVKPLGGGLAGRFRMRTGDYRVQFEVRGETVLVEKVGHRDGFYEE